MLSRQGWNSVAGLPVGAPAEEGSISPEFPFDEDTPDNELPKILSSPENERNIVRERRRAAFYARLHFNTRLEARTRAARPAKRKSSRRGRRRRRKRDSPPLNELDIGVCVVHGLLGR